MKVSQMTQQTVSVRIRLLRQHCHCQLLRLRRTSSDNVCDICWLNPRAKVVFVPCGQARFCDSCARQMFATTNKCGICRQQIDLLLQCLYLIDTNFFK